MRLLFAFAGGTGHAEPLLPIARAAVRAGHDVAFAGRSTSLPAGEFTVYADGAGEAPARRIPLRRLDLEREENDVRTGIRTRAGPRAGAVRDICIARRPDAVVCDETDAGALLAAEQLRLPRATVVVLAAGGFLRPDVVDEPLREVRAALGMRPDPEPVDLVLAPFPPRFRDPRFPLPPTAHAIRPAAVGTGGGPGRPTVYATLGTAFTLEAGDLLPRVLAGLRELPVDVVVTVGVQLDPAELGPQPGVRVERFVPQAEILPRCHAVVCHGGSGSVIGALAHGLPLVVLPLGADQAHNAARVAALGAGHVLDAVDATPATVRAAVDAVLREPSYRRAAERLRAEAAALPGADAAVGLIEALGSSPRG